MINYRCFLFFFFKQKTAYEMRISDWSSDVCSSDLAIQREREEMLAIYESPNNLPVPLFGKLAGKSKDQINRELKAGKLLSISLGNREIGRASCRERVFQYV